MTSELKCPVTVVNTLSVHGFANGVVNLFFTTAQWVPEKRGDEIAVGIVEAATADLRMDLVCAQQVYEALGRYLKENTKAETLNS